MTSNYSNHVQTAQSLINSTLDDGRIKLKFLTIIGTGAYGTVLLAQRLDNYFRNLNEYYAVKCLPKFGLDDRQRAFQRREIALHGLASSHQNIATVHAVIDSPSTIFVVLEFAKDGDLFSMITERFKYIDNDALIKSIFLQIIEAVQHCHKLGIYHRDLKPENILCTKDGDHILLADFGLATSERRSGDFGCGSSFYMSPDCHGALTHRKVPYCTKRNDIWSLGVILVNLTCGRNPWKEASLTDDTFAAYVREPDFLKTILPISEQTNYILKKIFTIEPSQRISLEDLKEKIKLVTKFTLTPQQLKHAHKAARQAAAATASAAAQALANRMYNSNNNSEDNDEVVNNVIDQKVSPPPPIAKESPRRRQRIEKDRLPLTPPTTPPKESLPSLRRVERKQNLKNKHRIINNDIESESSSNETDSSLTSSTFQNNQNDNNSSNIITPLSTPPASPNDIVKFQSPKSTFSKLTQIFKSKNNNNNNHQNYNNNLNNNVINHQFDIESDDDDVHQHIERVQPHQGSALAIDVNGNSINNDNTLSQHQQYNYNNYNYNSWRRRMEKV